MNVRSLVARQVGRMCFITFEVYLEAGHAISRTPKGISECQESAYDTYSPLKAKIIKIRLSLRHCSCNENDLRCVRSGENRRDRSRLRY